MPPHHGILEAEGDTVSRCNASRQADVLLLGYLFSPAELQAVCRRLGHDLDDDICRRTVDYHLQRTSHGSALAAPVHGLVPARAARADAWQYVHEALEADTADIQGGTTGEGIHLPSKAHQAFQRGLAALAHWLEREGFHRPVPRAHSGEITIEGQDAPVVIKLDVRASNTRSRRDRRVQEQLDSLRELGMEWAQATTGRPTGLPDAPVHEEAPGCDGALGLVLRPGCAGGRVGPSSGTGAKIDCQWWVRR